jgi:3-deoxy-D-manno-octulosonic-acid transferase
MYLLYSMLVHLVFVVLLPVLLVHPKLKEGFWRRLGVYRPGWPGLLGPVVWMHGASAGDLLSLEPVVLELKRQKPDCSVLLTTVTNSGMRLLEKGLAGVNTYGYAPYDLPWATARAIKKIKPDVLVLEYAEVWPALIHQAAKHKVRIMISNGRFNERSLGRYRWLYRVIGNPLKKVDLLCMREDVEKEHALFIGAPPAHVRVTGNTKFDRLTRENGSQRSDLRCALGLEEDALVWVAGSTHEGEEAGLLDVFVRLRKIHPELRLIIAPRYVERAENVAALARRRGLSTAMRSQGVNQEAVILLDTLGELVDVYSLARVAFVGGSFTSRGGQNILEPAACGKPVLYGPRMENFADSVRVLDGQGGIQVLDEQALEKVLGELLSQPDKCQHLGSMAKEAVRSVQGASRADVAAIFELLADRAVAR